MQAPLEEGVSSEDGEDIIVDEKGEVGENKESPQGPLAEGIRAELIVYAVEDITDISPKAAGVGVVWRVDRFWFVNDTNTYVEYGDGKVQRQVLIRKTSDTEYKILGYFEPGETGWDLIEGEDPYFGDKVDLYEYNLTLTEWVKLN